MNVGKERERERERENKEKGRVTGGKGGGLYAGDEGCDSKREVGVRVYLPT